MKPKKQDFQAFYTDKEGEHAGMIFRNCTEHEARLHAGGYYDPPFRVAPITARYVGIDLGADGCCRVEAHAAGDHVVVDKVDYKPPEKIKVVPVNDESTEQELYAFYNMQDTAAGWKEARARIKKFYKRQVVVELLKTVGEMLEEKLKKGE